MAALLRANRAVLRPWGDNQRYDLVIDEGDGRFSRVQCKTGKLDKSGSSLTFPTRSVAGGVRSRDYRGQIEFFGVYAPEIDKVYLVPIDAVGVRAATLRLTPSKNGQIAGVRMATEFELKI